MIKKWQENGWGSIRGPSRGPSGSPFGGPSGRPGVRLEVGFQQAPRLLYLIFIIFPAHAKSLARFFSMHNACDIYQVRVGLHRNLANNNKDDRILQDKPKFDVFLKFNQCFSFLPISIFLTGFQNFNLISILEESGFISHLHQGHTFPPHRGLIRPLQSLACPMVSTSRLQPNCLRRQGVRFAREKRGWISVSHICAKLPSSAREPTL